MRPDEELIQEARAATEGDTRAFEQLMQRHQASVLANCRYLTRSPDDAEDLAQEVFVKVFFKLHTFEGRSQFKTWVQRIKVNHCLNFLKKKKNVAMVDAGEPVLEKEEAMQVKAKAHGDVAAREERERIQEILESMPDQLRVPLILCDLDGLPYQEIADTLGIGLSAAKMRIKRAREAFRAHYDEAKDEPRAERASSAQTGSESRAASASAGEAAGAP